FGSLISMSGFLNPQGAASVGWFGYTPLSNAAHSPGIGGDLWVFGLGLQGFGTILGGVNIITTIIALRAPGVTMWRIPIFTWNSLITAIMILIVFLYHASSMLVLVLIRRVGHMY